MADSHAHDHHGHGHEGHDHMMAYPGNVVTPQPHDDSMDHSAHDHSAMGSMPPMHSMMMMFFHFGYNETVLFESWKITNIGGLVGSMIGIFIMAALYEGLKYYREYLFWRSYNSIQYRSVTTPDEKGSIGTSDHRIVQPDRPTMLSWPHALQTVLHIIQVVISYFLMLIFMTYNVWLCIAVLAGAGTGYFLFGWKKSVVVDVTEHCH
ncbi:high affinity copper uptake protein 1 isoform X2 [Ischnura elegans]|uniref:high affinity copper uptake protein 1 isoform X2 n=1 Tax=Ischnura elegans TaxID=197161 RepID=UPI001ED8AE17|nr:high affinity copper uptake protein 1 isoform X2 [Ischnura elegans]